MITWGSWEWRASYSLPQKIRVLFIYSKTFTYIGRILCARRPQYRVYRQMCWSDATPKYSIELSILLRCWLKGWIEFIWIYWAGDGPSLVCAPQCSSASKSTSLTYMTRLMCCCLFVQWPWLYQVSEINTISFTLVNNLEGTIAYFSRYKVMLFLLEINTIYISFERTTDNFPSGSH